MKLLMTLTVLAIMCGCSSINGRVGNGVKITKGDTHIIVQGATETCGDGIDQSCSGFDSVCVGTHITALKAGVQTLVAGVTNILPD